MPIVADAAVAVRGDLDRFNKDLKSGLNKAETQAKGFGSTMDKVMSPRNLVGGLAGGFAVAQVVSFFGDATNAAAEFNDSVSATGIIFGEEMIPAMEAWGDAAASNFGASKQEALSAANVIATLGKSAGLAGEDLVGFSQEMVQLGGDLASMFGGTTQDAITAVGAALRGESEPIRRYGVLLDDATLRQKAFEMGLISTIKNALTPQQRVLAAQAAILAQTSDAQGNFADTAGDAANLQRTLAAELANVNIEIGKKLLPVMVKLVTFVKDDGIPIVRGFIKEIDKLGKVIEGTGKEIAAINKAVIFVSLNFGEMGDRVHEIADRTGEDFHDLKQRISRDMAETGSSFEEAADEAERWALRQNDATLSVEKRWIRTQDQFKAEGERYARTLDQMVEDTEEGTGAIGDDIEGTASTTSSAWSAMLDTLGPGTRRGIENAILVVREVPGGIAATLRDGQTIVGTDAADLSAKITDAFRQAKEDSIAEAAGLITGLVSLFTEEDFVADVEEQTQLLAEQWSDYGRAVSELTFLASEEIRQGLASEDAGTRADTIARVNEHLAQYQRIPPEVRTLVEQTNPELVAGLQSNFELVSSELQRQIGMESAELREMLPIWRQAGLDAVADHAEGILHNRMLAVYAAGQVRRESLTEFENTHGFYESGQAVGNEYARGLDSRFGTVRDAAGRLGDAVRGQIGIRSEPKDHDSPLYGHMKWGGNLVRDIAGGIEDNLGLIHKAWEDILPFISDATRAAAIARQIAAGGTGEGTGWMDWLSTAEQEQSRVKGGDLAFFGQDPAADLRLAAFHASRAQASVLPPSPIEPSPESSSAGGAITVNLLDRMEVRSPRDIASGLRMLEQRGYLGK